MKDNRVINTQVAEAKVPPVVMSKNEQMPVKVELYLDDPEIQNLRAHCPVPRKTWTGSGQT